MSVLATSLGACKEKHPAALSEDDLELPPLVHDCCKPEGGDMTVQPPQPYVLAVNNLPDENA